MEKYPREDEIRATWCAQESMRPVDGADFTDLINTFNPNYGREQTGTLGKALVLLKKYLL